MDSTIITYNGIDGGSGQDRGAIQYRPYTTAIANDELFEFTGFTISGGNMDHHGGLITIDNPSKQKAISNVKIHHNVFKNDQSTAISINGPIYGVAYSNIFDRVLYSIRDDGYDDVSWAIVPREYGTSSNFYFEDNTIECSSPGECGHYMTGQGGGLVYRYNYQDQTNSLTQEYGDHHGLQSMTTSESSCDAACGNTDDVQCIPTKPCCQQWSSIKTEHYGNMIVNIPSSPAPYLWLVHRGSWMLMFNNLLSGAVNAPTPQYSQYSCDSCQDPAYPAYSQHIQNTYAWNNHGNGVEQRLTKRLDYCADLSDGYRITENVDYWNFNPNALDGNAEKGINCGSAPPVGKCSIGDGYWQTSYSPCSSPPATMEDLKTYTQSGRLYVCTAPDTWTAYYQPYTYPHPLRGGSCSPINPADINPCDGCVRQDEMIQYIQKWKVGQATLANLMEAIRLWKQGC
jgi:hypothetical protein